MVHYVVFKLFAIQPSTPGVLAYTYPPDPNLVVSQ
jgi:hypothetical protein